VAEELATQTVAREHAQHHHYFLVDALRVEAAIWIRQERWDEAEAALQEAVTLAHPMPYPYAEARALCTYGDLLVASGQPEQARDQYAAALAILRRLGEIPYAERIQRALAEMARPRRRPASDRCPHPPPDTAANRFLPASAPPTSKSMNRAIDHTKCGPSGGRSGFPHVSLPLQRMRRIP
jgi:tetratricopeptide (TPR) repeat protein